MASIYKKNQYYLAWTPASAVMFVQGRNLAVSSFTRSSRNVSSIKKCRYPLQITVMTNDSFDANIANDKNHDSDKTEIQDQYAAFSKMLGVEDQTPTTSKSNTDNVVTKAKQRKVEIDPRDYDMFNALLEKSGGTGRRPKKGSKKYQTVPTNISSAPTEDQQLQDTSEIPTKINDENQISSSTSPTNIVEETENGYEFMMEEFGSGIHGHLTVNRSSDNDNTQEREVKQEYAPTLLQKPSLPERDSILSTSFTGKKNTVDPSSILSKPKDRSSSVINPAPALDPKPVLSSHNSMIEGVAENVDNEGSEKEKELPCPDPLLAPPIRNRDNSSSGERDAEINTEPKGQSTYGTSNLSLQEKNEDPKIVSQVLVEKPQFPVKFSSQLGMESSEKNFMLRRKKVSRRTPGIRMLRLENPRIITERS